MFAAENQIHIYDINVSPRLPIRGGGETGCGLGGGETGAEGGGKREAIRGEKRDAESRENRQWDTDSICVVYMNCRFSHAPVVEAAIMELPKGTKASHEKGRLR